MGQIYWIHKKLLLWRRGGGGWGLGVKTYNMSGIQYIQAFICASHWTEVPFFESFHCNIRIKSKTGNKQECWWKWSIHLLPTLKKIHLRLGRQISPSNYSLLTFSKWYDWVVVLLLLRISWMNFWTRDSSCACKKIPSYECKSCS